MSWYGGYLQLSSCVKTLGMGGLFIFVTGPPPVGTEIRLAFDPVEACGRTPSSETLLPARASVSGFTRIGLGDKLLLQKLRVMTQSVIQGRRFVDFSSPVSGWPGS